MAPPVSFQDLDLAHLDLATGANGEELPPVAWIENAGIDLPQVQVWAVQHLRGALEILRLECGDMTDGELLLTTSTDMFMRGLALGIKIGDM